MDSHMLSVMDHHHNSDHQGKNQPLLTGLVMKSPRKKCHSAAAEVQTPDSGEASGGKPFDDRCQRRAPDGQPSGCPGVSSDGQPFDGHRVSSDGQPFDEHKVGRWW